MPGVEIFSPATEQPPSQNTSSRVKQAQEAVVDTPENGLDALCDLSTLSGSTRKQRGRRP
jgi:hypothetical protein